MSKQYNTYRKTKRTLRFAARCILTILVIAVISTVTCILIANVHSQHTEKTAADASKEISSKKPDPITIHIDGDGHDVTNKVESGEYRRLDVTDLDMYLLSGALRTLAPGQSFECKKTVICVILNRMKYYKCSAEDIINQPDQFDDTEQWYYGPASEEDTEAVLAAITDYTVPTTVFYYSLSSYPSWGDSEDWKQISDYYFSVSKEVFNSYNCSSNDMVIKPVETLVTIH